MEKEDNYSASFPGAGFDYSIDHNQPQQHDHHHMIKSRINETQSENSIEMVDYMLDNPPSQQQQRQISTLDHLSFADVMQFADFGPRLGFTHQSAITSTNSEEEESGIDPVHFLKFPVLNESLVLSPTVGENDQRKKSVIEEDEEGELREEGEKCNLENNNNNNNSSVQLQFVGDNENNNNTRKSEAKNKRRRARTLKTNEEVESQRMTHIAVERNRRKQMNEHLRVLRSLMPGSYVQRGDQASIIGGAIEFVRELEQLLQCLESQKRRRLYGDAPRGTMGESSSLSIQQQPQPPLIFPLPPPNDQMKIVGFEPGLQEETSEMKSCLADVEVKLLGFDAMIKILSRRRPGQLIKTIAALEDLQLNILHTNITTIEHTVLYSFNVKVTGEAHCTAEDIANSVQQIFSFIHASSSI